VLVDSEELGNLIVKPTVVEQQLLRKTSGTLDNHTLNKYRSCLEACFEPSELREYLDKELIATGSLGAHDGPLSGASTDRSRTSSFVSMADSPFVRLPAGMWQR
jgi:hypothetical protein